MLKKTLQLGIVLFFIGNGSFAQWSGAGSSDITTPIYRDGNVGIGTSTPSFKLQVNGFSEISDQGVHDPYGYGVLQLTRPANTGDDKFYLACVRAGNTLTGLGYVPNSNTFGIWASPASGANSTPTLALTADGNVGIGTTSLGSFKLAVEGKIGAREIQVTLQNPFPDYVFGSNYKLRSLSNLEQYINQNKHLPGIPSAGEVEKNGGVELGKLNTKLLEKVEELTLYVIELKKENQQMKKEIKKLSQRK